MTKKRIFKAVFAAVTMAAALAALVLCANAVRVTPGRIYDVMITVGKDETSRHITWQSAEGEVQTVVWAPAADVADGVFPAAASRAVVAREGATTFRALLTDLMPGTEYAYRVGSDAAGWSDVYTFRTGTPDGEFSFLLTGDPQIGGNILDIDVDNWNAAIEKARNWFGRDVEFLMSVGDQIDTGTEEREYDYFAYPAWLRSLSLMTLPGNHDDTSLYSRFFTYADVDPATTGDAGRYGGDYWVAYDGCLFVTINSNDVDLELHRDFITRAVAEYTALYGEPNWKIGAMHYSSYSAASGRWDSNYRYEYPPLFINAGFDAVLSGHDHVYLRTYMMDVSAEPDDDPADYTAVGDDPFGSVVDPAEGKALFITANSGSGSKLYPLTDTDLPWVAVKSQENVPYITKVDVTPDMLTFTTYRTSLEDGVENVVDFFAIHRRAGVEADEYAPTLTVPQRTEFDAADAENFDLLLGVTAYDNFDGDLTSEIKINGNVDPARETLVKYTVTDRAGNRAGAVRRLVPVAFERPVASEKTVWKYRDDGELPFDIFGSDYAVWTRAGFDDGEWSSGIGPFGFFEEYPEGSDHKTLPYVTELGMYYPDWSEDAGYNVANYFFRTTFDLDDPDGVDRLIGRMRIDDGADVYVNGVKVASFSMPLYNYMPWGYGGVYDPGGVAKFTFFIIDDPQSIAALDLRKTGNVVAVEVYQGTDTSSDIYFDFPYLDLQSYTAPEGPAFVDVVPGTWYCDGVTRAYERGLFAGVSDGVFSPSGTMTRAMAWRVLARLVGAEVPDGEKWYSGARIWARENGVSDGTDPDGPLTREQLVVMLYGLAGKPEGKGDISGFNDAASVASWARDAMSWAVGRSLVSGRSGGMLAPKARITRAEACTILVKYDLD